MAVLRPSLAPLRAMMAAPTTDPATSATSIGGADGAAQEQAHDDRELDVPHPHARGIRERGDEQEASRARGGDQVLGERVGVA